MTTKQIGQVFFFLAALILFLLAGVGVTDTPHLKIQPLGLACLTIALGLSALP